MTRRISSSLVETLIRSKLFDKLTSSRLTHLAEIITDLRSYLEERPKFVQQREFSHEFIDVQQWKCQRKRQTKQIFPIETK